MPTAQEVRVTRSGNTRAFPIPAAIARSIGLEAGDQFDIQVYGDSVLYRKTGSLGAVAHSGEGPDRFFTPARGRTISLTETGENDSLLNDWDF